MLVAVGSTFSKLHFCDHHLTSNRIYTFAWLFGFFISMTTYYVINRWIAPQHESLIEEAVYPPSVSRGDVTPDSEDAAGSTDYEVKDGVATTVKELV